VSNVKARLGPLWIAWFSVIVAVGLFYVLLILLRSRGQLQPQHMKPHFPELIAVVGVVEAVMSFVLPQRQLAAAIRALNIEVAEEGGEIVGSFRESAVKRRVVVDAPAAVERAFPAYFKALHVGLALPVSMSLFGLLLGYIGGSLPVASTFFVVALVLIVSRYPRVATIVRAIEQVTGASCSLVGTSGERRSIQ
jgi:hypothetical protein